MKHLVIYFPFLVCTALFVVGCGQQADQLDHGWTPPVKVTDSIENLVGGVHLHKFQDTIVCLQSLEGESAKCFFWNHTNNSWSEATTMSVPGGLGWEAIDAKNKKVLLPNGNVENEQLVMRVYIGTIEENVGLGDVSEKKWTTDKKSFFGEAGTNVQLKGTGLNFEAGVLSDSDIYIPYTLGGETYHGRTPYGRGPFNDGIFHSTNSGATWRLERVSDSDSSVPSVCKTKDYYYYFARSIVPDHGYQLWFSRKPVNGSSWDEPKTVTKTFATTNERYVNIAEGDKVYVCWMDCRDDMRRFSMGGPNIENDDIAYCHRKDSDADWSQDVILSKGLLYSYLPSISVEENNVVVAWTGIRTAEKNHTEYDPNDIYYVTSRDGGETWSKPMMVTDKAKDGITSGKPQVMLLNGVIHLFYIQGALRKPQQLSPGLTKLNQSPWPIYYTQHPFPK